MGKKLGTSLKNYSTTEANRAIIESLPRMKDGKGFDHYIDALREEGMDFVLEKLGFQTSATQSNTSLYSRNDESSRLKTLVKSPVESSEEIGSSSFSNSIAVNSITLEGCSLEESDGAVISRRQIDENQYSNIDDTVPDSENSSEMLRVPAEQCYENYRTGPPEHAYEDITKEGEIHLLEPTTLQCPQRQKSSCPDEFSALTKDAAWHANINDTTIHKVVDDLCACPAGKYIMWYSKAKGTMLVSVAVPRITKKHVHFKMLPTWIGGVLHYQFDSRFCSPDPVACARLRQEEWYNHHARKTKTLPRTVMMRDHELSPLGHEHLSLPDVMISTYLLLSVNLFSVQD
ncbi:uncharacterized protein LOC117331681 [Pecten maximus]|uniref:uncharacterized protein LOC117331681 n=1 Tax=Pecten maximus TaxID=6579 RepID=UPI001457F64B|nr:uncharacterized protein LOC117331681 [Pecten maximus]